MNTMNQGSFVCWRPPGFARCLSCRPLFFFDDELYFKVTLSLTACSAQMCATTLVRGSIHEAKCAQENAELLRDLPA